MRARHAIHRVVSLQRVGAYTLLVAFEDGTQQTIDFAPVLVGQLFEPLRDPVFFARVSIDPEAHTLVWPNGADFDPTVLHDWPMHADAMRELARGWA